MVSKFLEIKPPSGGGGEERGRREEWKGGAGGERGNGFSWCFLYLKKRKHLHFPEVKFPTWDFRLKVIEKMWLSTIYSFIQHYWASCVSGIMPEAEVLGDTIENKDPWSHRA